MNKLKRWFNRSMGWIRSKLTPTKKKYSKEYLRGLEDALNMVKWLEKQEESESMVYYGTFNLIEGNLYSMWHRRREGKK